MSRRGADGYWGVFGSEAVRIAKKHFDWALGR